MFADADKTGGDSTAAHFGGEFGHNSSEDGRVPKDFAVKWDSHPGKWTDQYGAGATFLSSGEWKGGMRKWSEILVGVIPKIQKKLEPIEVWSADGFCTCEVWYNPMVTIMILFSTLIS
jgi:hypothetical protein